jgi:hypothetical protein
MDWADQVGFDAKGAKTGLNDLPAILENYKLSKSGHFFRMSTLRKNDRLDPLYYKPGDHLEFFSRPSNQNLFHIAEPSGIVVSKSRKNKTLYRYLEVGDVDQSTGEILNTTEYMACDLPSRAKYIVRAGMILFPNHRNSIAAKRAPVLVGEDYDGIVVTSRFIPLFCKVPPAYVYHILNLDFIKEKLLTMVSGGSSTEIKWDTIKDIPIPMPPGGDFDSFIADVLEMESKLSQLNTRIHEIQTLLSRKFNNLFVAA